MERLNDIMMRTAQRRQNTHDQQVPQQGTAAQGQQSRPPLPRRASLPEQSTRLRQDGASVQPPQSSQQAGRYGTSGASNRGEQGTRYPQQRPYNPVQRKSVNERRPMYYHQPAIQEPPIPQNSGNQQRQHQITGDYYDTYEAVPAADVQEDWEDDATAMRYGDWEGDDSMESVESNEVSRHTHPPLDADYTIQQGPTWSATRAFSRQPGSPLATRELTAMPGRELENRSPLTRRDTRMPQSQQIAQVSPPAPQAPQQEAQRYHRNTQPLNPRAIAGMGQSLPQEMPRPTQSIARQAPVRSQIIQPAPMPAQGPCPLCKGAGYLRADVPYGHPNFGKPIACDCKEAERAEKRRMHLRTISNLDAFRDKSFKNFNPRVPGMLEAFKLSQDFANDPDGWLLLIGRNGCGKTHLAAAIANQHLAMGSLVLFATVPDLLDHLRATFAPSSTVVYDQLFSSMREAELLVLDDLGSEQNSSWASEKLFQLLNYRYNSRFPTVITTNNLRLQSVDERIRSRLMDKSLVTEVIMDKAHDYRPHNPRRE